MVSTALVESSRIRIFGFLSSALAIQRSLLLSTGYVVTAFHDHGIIFIRELLNKAVGLRQLTDSLDFLVAGVLITPADIFIDTSCKQDIFLKHHGHLVTQCFQVVFSYVDTADFHTSSGHVIQTRDQLHQCGFGASGTADDTDDLTALNMQIDIFKDRLPPSPE